MALIHFILMGLSSNFVGFIVGYIICAIIVKIFHLDHSELIEI